MAWDLVKCKDFFFLLYLSTYRTSSILLAAICKLNTLNRIRYWLKDNPINCMCRTVKRTMKGKTRLEPQQKLYKIIAERTAIWIIRQKHETCIQAAEMKFLLGQAGNTVQMTSTMQVYRQMIGIRIYKKMEAIQCLNKLGNSITWRVLAEQWSKRQSDHISSRYGQNGYKPYR